MPATVKTQGANTRTHETANDAAVHDGHLIVRRFSDVVAIYSPGHWKSVEVTQEER